jgi:exosortase K
MKTKLGVLTVVALVAYALKRHYADATTDTLSWILTPSAHLVSLVTGVAFTAVPGEGYFSAERMFLIEKACAGVNFMIAAFALVALALLHRVPSGCSVRRVLLFGPGATIVGVSLLASYLAALVVNTVRIVIAMWLAAHPAGWSSLSPAEIHRLEGITVYFGGLWLLYGLVQWIDRSGLATRGGLAFRYALPLGCYYLVTLVVPLANGVQAGRAFFAHAMVVLLVPPVLILLVYATRWLFSRYPRNVAAGSRPHVRRAGNHAAVTTTGITAAPNA